MQKITRIQCGSVNCFCIEENGSALLIDAAHTQYIDKVIAVCRDKNIRLIVLTHGHIDHIQNAATLSKMLNAPIAMHKEDYALTQNNMAEPMTANTIIGKIALAAIKNELMHGKAEPFEPDVFLNDSDTLEDYGVRASIIGLPGHTKGSIGILAGDTDLFVGDALMNSIYPAKSLMFGNYNDMLKSADKISGYKSVTVHFGHGKSIPNRKW